MAQIVVTTAGTTVMVGQNDMVVINIPGGGDVTIIADPNQNVDKFTIEFRDDSEADSASVVLSTFSEDNLQIDIKQYDPTDSLNLVGAENGFIDPNNTDEFGFSYTGADGNTYSAHVQAKDGGERDFTADPPPIVVCFGRGTLIETDRGRIPVEQLKEWDCVRTVDNGLMPIRWIGHSRLDTRDLLIAPHLRPVRMERHALGHNIPDRPTIMSPNHRILVEGWKVETMFGEPEMLVPVKALVDGKTIRVDNEATEIDYFHILLDTHELIHANGVVAESLLLAEQSEYALSYGMEESHEILGPEFDTGRARMKTMARPTLKVVEGRLLSAA